MDVFDFGNYKPLSGSWNGGFNGGFNGRFNGGFNGGFSQVGLGGSPLLADALRRSREATCNLNLKPRYRSWDHVLPPAGSEQEKLLKKLRRWDFSVNLQLALHELLQPISYAASGEAVSIFVNGTKSLTMRRPSFDLLGAELQEVADLAQLREDRSSEILIQAADTMPFWGAILPLSSDKTPYTILLLTIATQLSSYVLMRLKHEFACPRPFELCPDIQPMIPTPRHGAFPMGHVSEAVIVCSILSALTKNEGSDEWKSMTLQLERLAFRIGQNRVVAGVHYPVDLVAGMVIGKWLARFVVSACQDRDDIVISEKPQIFNAHDLKPSERQEFIDHPENLAIDSADTTVKPAAALRKSALMGAIFAVARAEWDWLDTAAPKPIGNTM